MTTGYRDTKACLEDVDLAVLVLTSGEDNDSRRSVVVISKTAEVF